MILQHDEAISTLFPSGLILHRGVVINDGQVDYGPVFFDQTRKGSFMCRCTLNGNFLYEPEINTQHGNVVFLTALPPRNWTHLIVTGTSKKMQGDPRLNPKGFGRAIFAEICEPFEDYLSFRKEMYEAVLLQDDWEGKVQHCKSITPGPGKRLVYQAHGEPDNDGKWLPYYSIIGEKS